MKDIKKSNPLLQLNNNQLPDFASISAKHFLPALKASLDETLKYLNNLLKASSFTWENLLAPFELQMEKVNRVWSVISQLNSVKSTPEIRTAYQEALPLITEFMTMLSHNHQLFKAVESIYNSVEFNYLDAVQQKIIRDQLRDFKLSGIDLPKRLQKTCLKLNQQLGKLGQKFSCNVMDTTQQFNLILTAEEVQGLPDHIKALGQQQAQKAGQDGYLFHLDFVSYQALITFSEDRDVRKRSYIAYVTRASQYDAVSRRYDNTKNISKILNLRLQLAQILGFNNYAECSLATKMAQQPQRVMKFLQQLVRKALPKARRELAQLTKFAQQKLGLKKLAPWDISFVEEKFLQAQLKLSQEELRPYFPIEQVLEGLFKIVQQLYGITVIEKENIAVWHPSVRYFEIYDEASQKLLGSFYGDFYYRENKHGGAWMGEYRNRTVHTEQLETPVAYLVSNFAAPLADRPALLTHDEVTTLLHEFGHTLQHLLTEVNYVSVAGVQGIPWDAVEFASQFMENWAWQPQSLKLLSRHYVTGKNLPPRLIKRLVARRQFNAALRMLRQLEYAIVDFQLHQITHEITDAKVQRIVKAVQREVRITPTYRMAQTLTTFSHIFDGGYAAGYYSYKWAEVLAADAFSLFKRGGILKRSLGERFRKAILATGGSADPLVLFRQLMGRDPDVTALLKQDGIV